MRTWVYGSKWGSRISYLLVMSLLLPLLIMTLPAKPAMAQVARLPQVAVLDFGVLPAVKASGILGRNATDAVVIEMTRTGRYDVTPRATVNQQLADLGLTIPLDNVGVQKLGQNLGNDFVASGDIYDVSFQENPRRARVVLSVRLTDVITGELANGAIETGFSSPSAPGFTPDDEKLLSDAIQNAAFNAVRTITSYTLPAATILQVRGNTEVILNRGTQDGIAAGLDMVVFRGTDRVGRIKVNSVRATNSTANILDIGKGIRPEDKARAVFNLPGYEITADNQIKRTPVKDIATYKRTGRRNNTKSVLAVILGLAAAIIIATLIFDPNSRTNGSGIGSLTARPFSEPSDIADGGSSARVEIKWNAAADTPQNNIIEYHIYRDGVIIGYTNQTTRQYTDSPELAGQTITYSEVAYGNAIITTSGNNTTAGAGTAGTTTTGGQIGGQAGGQAGGQVGGQQAGGQIGGQAAGISPDQPTTLRQVTTILSGLQVGVPHTYSVRVLFRQVAATTPTTGGQVGGGGGGQQGGGGGIGGGGGGIGGGGGGIGGGGGGQAGGQTAGNFLFKETPLTRVSGTATALARPVVVGPSGDQNTRRVPVRFNTVLGGNSYIVEFATTPTFSDKKVLNLRNGTAQPFFQTGTGLAASPVEFDLNSDNQFKNLPGGTRIFYRVGVRNLNDNPGPLPARERGVPNGDKYIYSGGETFFTKIIDPPAAP